MWGVALSFENFKVSKGVFGSEFVGLKNYINFFKNRNFLKMFRNTLAISSLNLFLGFPLPILLAILLNEIRNQKYKENDADAGLFAALHVMGRCCRTNVLFAIGGHRRCQQNPCCGWEGKRSVI